MGIFILTLGVALTIKADLGVGSWDAVNVALNRIYGLSIRLSCFILGIILLSFGIALYIRLELAPNSLDDFMVALSEKFNISISISKLLVDVLGLII